MADPEQSKQPLEEAVAAALEAGVTAVQLRAKALTDRDYLALAYRIKKQCVRFDALFIINDRVDIALAAGADGVHLGVDDMPLSNARSILGIDRVIGYSPGTDADTKTARIEGADYLGVGPVFVTPSKNDAGPAIGLNSLRHRVYLAGLPVIGIGGITSANARSVIETGAAGIAVMGAIIGASEPRSATADLRRALELDYGPK